MKRWNADMYQEILYLQTITRMSKGNRHKDALYVALEILRMMWIYSLVWDRHTNQLRLADLPGTQLNVTLLMDILLDIFELQKFPSNAKRQRWDSIAYELSHTHKSLRKIMREEGEVLECVTYFRLWIWLFKIQWNYVQCPVVDPQHFWSQHGDILSCT